MDKQYLFDIFLFHFQFNISKRKRKQKQINIVHVARKINSVSFYLFHEFNDKITKFDERIRQFLTPNSGLCIRLILLYVAWLMILQIKRLRSP